MRPKVKSAAYMKILYNTGVLTDIPTGEYQFGIHGESLLNGGRAPIEAVAGGGNTFKSTTAIARDLIVLDRLRQAGVDTSLSIEDTEMNMQPVNMGRFASNLPSFNGMNPIDDGSMVITDDSMMYGDEFVRAMDDFVIEKLKIRDSQMVEIPFLDKDGKPMKIIPPSFWGIDSLTHWKTKALEKFNKSNLGTSEQNTINMKMGLDKSNFLLKLGRMTVSANHYCFLTSHYGKDSAPIGGNPNIPPPKKLNAMGSGEKTKGTTEQIYYVTHNMWRNKTAKPLTNQGTKGPEYPVDSTETNEPNLDLYVVDTVLLRGKFGPSGFTIPVVLSQKNGILPELTRFHYLRTNNYYGMNGGNTTFEMDLFPGLKLSRTTIRSKMKENPLLIRAIEITSDLLQLGIHRRHSDVHMSPAELFETLKKKGYNWEQLLNTREWWCPNNDKHPMSYLSTLDLLRMAHDKYRPYWLQKG